MLSAFPTRITPVNEAEAIFAPFWDLALREPAQWQVEEGAFKPTWCNVGYQGKTAFRMVRTIPVDATGYDQLVLSMSVPVEGTLTVTADQEGGVTSHFWTGKVPRKDEYVMDLAKQGTIRKLTVEVTQAGKPVMGTFYFLGLRKKAALADMMGRQRQFAHQPLDIFLAPKETKPTFLPQGGIVKDASFLQKIWEEREPSDGTIPESFARYVPEEEYRRNLNSANPAMFAREFDLPQRLISISAMVQRAVLDRNEALLRLAVRWALMEALTPQWDVPLSFFPDSSWEQRPFCQSGIAYGLAFVLEFGSELLSSAGRELIARRLAESGLGSIQFAMWKFRYLQTCNQFVVFSQGRLAAMLALETFYRSNLMPSYTELAYGELCQVLDHLVKPDGGFLEGVGYFSYTIGCAQPALAVYALGRGKSLMDVAPASLRHAGAMADVFISTDRRGGLIPHSSSQGRGRGVSTITAQFLSALAPKSQWTRLYQTMRKNSGNQPFNDLTMYGTEQFVPKDIPDYPSVARLPSMGVAASTRWWKEVPVKILMLGGPANYKGHRHQDKGSFVIECGGDTFAADPGGQVYAAADSDAMKGADRHNMLIPVGSGETWAVDSPVDIKPVVTGDKTAFTGTINPVTVWPKSMARWERRIESPTPNRIRIVDDYALKAGTGVKALWMTELPFKKLSDRQIELTGQNCKMVITASEGTVFSAETLIIRGKEPFSRLAWYKEGKEGTISLELELIKF